MSYRSVGAGCLTFALLGAAPATSPSRFELRGAVVYDVDAHVATASGKADLQSTNFDVKADSLSFDLRSNTLEADGNVRVVCPAGSARLVRLRLHMGSADGQAMTTPAGRPEHFDARTCALGGDDGSAAIPPLAAVTTRSGIRAHRVDIVLDSYIRFFKPSLGIGAGSVHVPAYSIVLGDGPETQQPAPTVAAEPLLGIVGAPESLTDARLRIDPHSGVGFGLTERIASTDRQSTALELSTANIGLRGDLLQNWQLAPHLHESLSLAIFKQFIGGRFGIDGTVGAAPVSASIIQSNAFQFGDLVLASPHEPLGKRSFYRGWVDLGYDRSPGEPVPFDERATAGMLLDSGRFRGPLGTELESAVDARTAFFNTGERHAIADASLSISEPLTRRLRLTESATLTPAFDHVHPGTSPLADPNAYIYPIVDPLYVPTNSGVDITGMLRSYTITARYEPHPGITFETSFTKAADSVATPQTVRPPVAGWFYMHVETPAHFGIEVGRSDLFGWQGIHLTPNYTFRITTPQ